MTGGDAMLPSHVELPSAYRILDSFGTQLEKWGIPITQLDTQTLYKIAEKNTGLNDFGDPYHREGLEVLLQSFDKDANLHFFGKFITRMVLINYLTQRLLFVEAQKRSPDIFRSKLNAPFIITGIPRSGTTFLHRMIADDPRNTGVPFWRLFRPFPTPGKRDIRQLTTRWELKLRRPIFPEMDTKHFIRENQEEECIWMMGLTLNSIVFWVIAPVSSFAEWLQSQDRTKYYQEFSSLLKAQQQVVPEKSLVLKAPDHTPNIDTILSVIPNARIIQLHRDPTTCLTSLNSLFYSTHRSVTNNINPCRLGETNKKMFTYYLKENRNIRADPRINTAVLDIQYTQLVADPIGTVKGLYNHFDTPWSEEFEARLQIFVDQQPKDKFGKHHYTPEQFGQSSRELEEHFAPYIL
jgi:hypothetical protein